jgi:hypothetical protein
MMIERRILEALDACRPGSDDLHSVDHPELAEAAALLREDAAVQEAFARVQHFDRRILAAMEEVELPTGLADRVKARLAAATPVGAPLPDGASLDVSSPEAYPAEPTTAVSLPIAVETTRRRWLWAASAIAASLAVAMGLWQFRGERDVQLSREEFRVLSKDVHTQVQEADQWQTDLTQAPVDRPFPASALLARVKGFQPLSLPGDRHAVAYNVTYHNQPATVIVYRATASQLDLVPPRNPFNTQGICIGLWQRDGLLFALVIEGSPTNYRRLLQSNQGTLG